MILKYIFGRIGLYFWGFVEKLNYFRDLGSKGKILSGSWGFYSGFLGDYGIICREQGSTDPTTRGTRKCSRFFLLCDGISRLYSLIF